jgi:flagellar biosynthesis regulator FlaF
MIPETPMYEFSYNDVVDDSHQVMRARERNAMDNVIAMLRAARDKGENSREALFRSASG